MADAVGRSKPEERSRVNKLGMALRGVSGGFQSRVLISPSNNKVILTPTQEKKVQDRFGIFNTIFHQ